MAARPRSLTATDTADITINPVNDAPDTAAGSGSGNEDTTIAVSLSGSDIDGSVASFKITSLPVNGTLYADAGLTDTLLVGETVAATGNAATVYFKPNLNYNGSASFTYAAVDNNGAEDATPATASITVNPVNDAPTVANAIADQNATQGSLFSFAFAANTFNDVDVGDTLAYTATLDTNAPLPAWLSFNAATRTFSGTPGSGDVGTIAVKVTATDGSSRLGIGHLQYRGRRHQRCAGHPERRRHSSGCRRCFGAVAGAIGAGDGCRRRYADDDGERVARDAHGKPGDPGCDRGPHADGNRRRRQRRQPVGERLTERDHGCDPGRGDLCACGQLQRLGHARHLGYRWPGPGNRFCRHQRRAGQRRAGDYGRSDGDGCGRRQLSADDGGPGRGRSGTILAPV